MKHFLSNLAVALILAQASPTLGAPHDAHERREAQACTVPANGLKNGGFESGSLAPWNFTKTYNGSPGSPIGYTIGSPGSSGSADSLTISGLATATDAGNVANLFQTFTVCKNVTYSLTWSVLQVPGQTVETGGAPSMSVDVYAPAPQNASPYLLADYRFGKASYNATVYKQPFQPNVNHPPGKWVTYTAPFPFANTGLWLVRFRVYTVAYKGDTGTKVRIDNVVAKPLG